MLCCLQQYSNYLYGHILYISEKHTRLEEIAATVQKESLKDRAEDKATFERQRAEDKATFECQRAEDKAKFERQRAHLEAQILQFQTDNQNLQAQISQLRRMTD